MQVCRQRTPRGLSLNARQHLRRIREFCQQFFWVTIAPYFCQLVINPDYVGTLSEIESLVFVCRQCSVHVRCCSPLVRHSRILMKPPDGDILYVYGKVDPRNPYFVWVYYEKLLQRIEQRSAT